MDAWRRLVLFVSHTTKVGEHEMADLGITPAQYLVLAAVSGRGPQRQTDLARHLGITQASVSQIVSRMVANGHIVRQADGRANVIELTTAGHALYRSAEPKHWAHITRRFDQLDDDQLLELSGLLALLSTDEVQR